ncbi:type VI secretion system Vgr family protein [Chondromyces crocatus]|uniref:Uncharacterized protein n=1 Tax=Chondromyces crocatus TaxID=52 RepID=A0A0K1E835_CHOCO|nr:type VI secretion system tip protein TssI/VgrG [Chondromyces crocatus]AKT37019.1 uncharacterized protein CMC5_011450 [Chondromyces crocatus]
MARQFQAELILPDIATFHVARFVATHESGRPPEVQVEAILEGVVELDALVGRAGALRFGVLGEESRTFPGIIESATIVGGTERGLGARPTHYRLRLVSVLCLLARSVDSRIFQHLSVPEIVTQVLSEHGVTRVEQRLVDTYEPREYCVQYQESALDFVSRLCEHEGIHLQSEPDAEGAETIVLCDDSETAPFMAGDPALAARPRTALLEAEDAIYALRPKRRVRSGKVVLRDFDFEHPKLDLTVTAAAKESPELAVYDYPGGYSSPEQGERLARIRLEAEQVASQGLEVDAVCARLVAGHRLRVIDAGELDGSYFTVSVTHTFDGGVGEGAGKASYLARARLLPEAIPFRPPRRTPIPVIAGPQTATVVAPEGAAPESIHTDKQGRCKVRFHWDRSGIQDERASCWMRVMQLQTSGSLVLPRVDWEVIVEFLEGDPDRPIITGRLYNGVFMPPYALPEGKTRTALRSASTPGGGGANEIRFEDKAGAEEIMMHAQRDMKVAAANNAKRRVGNNETTVIGNNASLQVGGEQTTKITKGEQITIGANQVVTVGGDRKVEVNAVSATTVHGNATTTVGGNQFEMDGNPLEALLALAAQAAEQFAQSLADNAVAAIQANVDGAVNQVMGPINALNDQVQGISDAMKAVGDGDLSGMGAMVAGASRLPGAGEFAAALGGRGSAAGRGGGGGGGGGVGGGGGGDALGGLTTAANGAAGQANALTAMAAGAARGAMHQAIGQGVGAAHQALASALGVDGGGGGGSSMANQGGPEGDVAGIDATDREKGPGRATARVVGTHEESVGSMKILAAIQDIDTNVGASRSQDVGVGTLQLAIGDYAETVGGSKDEKALGLIVLSKAGESETVGGSKTTMVGGAIIDKLSGSQVIEAGGPATFVGAFHKIEAKGAITFKCGASEVVIAEEGISITSPLVVFLAPKIQLPKKVTEL